ncbi:hypothetical protein KP509_12G068500 [Ceratopteris richardii]|nr:hypothetical protein KP509_12G068500 [Ceratopteris richardii]
MGAMYAATLFIGISNSSSVMPVVGIERTVYYRERAAGMYSALPYAFAQTIIEIPYVLIQTILYTFVVYSMLGFIWTAGKFFWFLFLMFFSFLYFSYYGMMCVALTPSHHFAAVIASACYGLWNLFSGFLIPRTSIPIWWRWFCWATPVSWTLYGLITSQLGDLDDQEVEIPEQGQKLVSKFITEYFGYHQSFLSIVCVMHVVFVILFAFVFGICMKYINFQRR